MPTSAHNHQSNPNLSGAKTPKLSRELGVAHASAIVVGTIIGSGIFLVPSEMMQAVGSARLVYLAWIVGGVLSLAGAITYAELGAMKPQAGGEYIYIRDAYGPLPAFLYGWTWFAIAKPASIATLVTGLVRILGTFPALAFLNQAFLTLPFTITYGQLMAIMAAVLITALNYLGVRYAGDFQLVFTLLKIVIIVAVSLLAFTAASGSWQNFATSFIGARGGVAGFMAALVAALWAYDGWNDLNMVSGEIRNPARAIPIALVAGVAVVAALYMLTNAAVQYVLPAAQIAASPRPMSEATAIAVGYWGAAIVSAGMALSILVTLNGTIMSGARVPYRHVARWLLLSRAGRGASAISYALGRTDRAAPAVDRALAVRGQLPPTVLAGDFRRVAFLHDRREYRLRAATERAGRAAAVSSMGIPGGSGDVCHRRSGAAVLHVYREHPQLGVGAGCDRGRLADLFVFLEEQETRQEQRVEIRSCYFCAVGRAGL